MAQGLILLVFIGILIAVFTVRVRRRMGIASNSKTWLMIITWAVVLGLALCPAHADQGRPGPPLIGISNQTALPSWVGREPHRVASWSTR
jgi:hypothetical protein